MPEFYTPEQANKILPEVSRIVSRIVELKNQIDSTSSSSKGYERSKQVDELSMQISKLEERGIELKDMEIGLIDFPAKRFDEKVYLCWKLGEQEVLYWHNLTSGYRGRRPLKPALLRVK